MKVANRLWFLLPPLAAFGLWSMLASPRELFGIDPGPLGMFALVASTVGTLWLLSLTWMFDSDALAAFMRSRSLAWMEVLLLFCLISSQAVGWGVRAVHYWRDRQ